VIERIKAVDTPLRFETFISLSCHNCPDVVQALNLMAVLNPNVESAMIDGALFKGEVEARQIMAVPMVFVNGEHFGQGRMTVEEVLAKVSGGGTPILEPKEPFDVLVVGGGPAGSAAAVYAARKGIRTGVVAERFGGQVLATGALAADEHARRKRIQGEGRLLLPALRRPVVQGQTRAATADFCYRAPQLLRFRNLT